MHEELLSGLALVIVLGVCAQWLAWRLRLPSILLLLAFGFLAGPISGALNPDAVFGSLLFPIVSISVAVILYEGGLTLALADLPKVGGVVGKLVTIGVVVTLLLTTVAAHFVLKMDWPLAFLLGAVLSVTGPTVIIPLVRHVRPRGKLGAIAKWEGIIIDPIGAMLAVLVFEIIAATQLQDATRHAALSVLYTLLVGGGFGVFAAGLMAILFSRHAVPDYLDNAVSLMLVIGAFTVANAIQPESGLFAVTIMGFVLANQKTVDVRHIIDFKENLRVLLISTLFILLAARLSLAELTSVSLAGLVFVAILIVVVRPAAVWLSTLGSGLSWKERVFLAWMAPRGIVAAAVASVLVVRLEAVHPEAGSLVTYTLMVIVGTVAVYGLTAGPLARRLGLADPDPQGVLFVGAHFWARQIAEVLKREGVRVQMVDTNRSNVVAARMADLPTYFGSVLSEHTLTEIDLDGIGYMCAVTPNDAINALAGRMFHGPFGRANTYQLPVMKEHAGAKPLAVGMHGRLLFDKEATYPALAAKVAGGWIVRATSITDEFDDAALHDRYGVGALPLFIITAAGRLTPVTAEKPPTPQAGDTLIHLAPNDAPSNVRSPDESDGKS